jgi:hypothetical protein
MNTRRLSTIAWTVIVLSFGYLLGDLGVGRIRPAFR